MLTSVLEAEHMTISYKWTITTESTEEKNEVVKILTGDSTGGLGCWQFLNASWCRRKGRKQKALPRGKGSKLSLHSYKFWATAKVKA